jgi:beta-N-acetylhexosaminidase
MKDAASAILVAAVEGLELTSDEDGFFRRESPAGVTLFRRNIPQQDFSLVARLNHKLQETRPSGDPPLIIAVDQEGGRVSRFPSGFPNRGPAMSLEDGRFDAPALHSIGEYGQQVGAALGRVGVNVNFAPVLDILTEPTNYAIGDRCFGVTAEAVWLRAEAFLIGLQSQRILGCLKHFPGQGHATVDTHHASAPIDVNLQTLIGRELVPFKMLVQKSPMVMISHSIFSVLSDREASRSRVVIMDWLRTRLGFQGVVVSDDMNMGALPQDIIEWKAALIDAVAAGCDALLVCQGLDRCVSALEGLRVESRKSTAFARRLEDAAKRVTALRHSL